MKLAQLILFLGFFATNVFSSVSERTFEPFLATNTRTHTKDEIYFVSQKLTTSNLSYWRDFIEKAHDVLRGHNEGTSAFAENLAIWEKYPETDVRVTYACSVPPHEDPLPYQVIEMFFGVFTHDKMPFSTHMGISKNPLFKGDAHGRLSMDLHAFAARTTLKFHPSVEYMLTMPAQQMLRIFQRSGLALYLGEYHTTILMTQDLATSKDILARREADLETLDHLSIIGTYGHSFAENTLRMRADITALEEKRDRYKHMYNPGVGLEFPHSAAYACPPNNFYIYLPSFEEGPRFVREEDSHTKWFFEHLYISPLHNYKRNFCDTFSMHYLLVSQAALAAYKG